MEQQEEMLAKLMENEQQKKMFDTVMREVHRSMKEHFVTYMKLVQGDTSRLITQGAIKDGASLEDLQKFIPTLNTIMMQIGEGLQKQIAEQIASYKDK